MYFFRAQAAECAGLYADASLKLNSSKIGGAGAKDWLDVVEWNKKLFDGMQHFHGATGHEEAFEYGVAVRAPAPCPSPFAHAHPIPIAVPQAGGGARPRVRSPSPSPSPLRTPVPTHARRCRG